MIIIISIPIIINIENIKIIIFNLSINNIYWFIITINNNSIIWIIIIIIYTIINLKINIILEIEKINFIRQFISIRIINKKIIIIIIINLIRLPPIIIFLINLLNILLP